MIPEHIAVFIGIQEGAGPFPAIELYNLLVPLGHHPVGSTLTSTSILKLLAL